MRCDYREPRPDDASGCVGVLQDWIAQTPWMPMLHTRDSMERFWCRRLTQLASWVAVKDGRIVGFCARDQAHVTALYVDGVFRSQGVGKRLLDLAREECNAVNVWTFEANTQALAFYRREGFRDIARSDGDNEERLPDVQLRWTRK